MEHIRYGKVPANVGLVMTQFTDQVIFKDILRFFQKFLKYFNGITNSTFSVLPSVWFLAVIGAFNLNNSKLAMLSFQVSLWYFFMFLRRCS